MTQILNPNSVMVALGVLQPATTFEIIGFLRTMLPNAGELPGPDDILAFLKEREAVGHVLRVVRSDDHPSQYALTLAGHRYLTVGQRRVRDKLRFYLLRDAHRARFRLSDEGAKRLVGASPTSDASLSIKGSVANKVGQRVPSGRPYWPRIARQFDIRTGSSASSSDTFPEWLSFRNQRQCELAADFDPNDFELDFEGLAACIGVSPKIISQIANAPARHYRSFLIAKKSGDSREISSPRVFLRVIQWFLDDFILCHLPVHNAVNSFAYGRSVLTNALPHVGQPFVGTIDIEDFFGSVTDKSVLELLQSFGFRKHEATLIAALTTKNGSLPQGAPTSAVLSNAVLYDFDEKLTLLCAASGASYTRYADDITISAATRGEVSKCLAVARGMLAKAGLRINESKTRISSQGSQQNVTGVVVNDRAQPSRLKRRRLRAKFHNAKLSESVTTKEIASLRGHLSYMKMFPALAETRQVRRLEDDLTQIQRRAGLAESS